MIAVVTEKRWVAGWVARVSKIDSSAVPRSWREAAEFADQDEVDEVLDARAPEILRSAGGGVGVELLGDLLLGAIVVVRAKRYVDGELLEASPGEVGADRVPHRMEASSGLEGARATNVEVEGVVEVDRTDSATPTTSPKRIRDAETPIPSAAPASPIPT